MDEFTEAIAVIFFIAWIPDIAVFVFSLKTDPIFMNVYAHCQLHLKKSAPIILYKLQLLLFLTTTNIQQRNYYIIHRVQPYLNVDPNAVDVHFGDRYQQCNPIMGQI